MPRLIPEAIAQGFCPDRLRVQPIPGEEFVVERVSASLAGKPPFLPSVFTDDDTTSRFVVSGEMFEQNVRGWKGSARPLLIFDQFEELITLFEEAPVGEALRQAQRAKEEILRVLAALITDTGLHVKLLFSFREDYLAKIIRLFDFWPEIRDQYVRITPPSTSSLFEIIRGPFERFPGAFETEIEPDLAESIAASMGERDERGMVNLSELQIALVRLWQSKDPRTMFDERGIQGLLEDYTSETLESIPDLRSSTVALLSDMITESGARNVISEEDLLSRVEDEEGIPRDLLKEALRFLEQDARLIRREHRHEVAFYEIVSEFLAPWITRQREQAETIRELERAQALAAAAAKKRLRRVGLVLLILVPLVVIPFALFAVAQRNEATKQRDIATSQRNRISEQKQTVEELAKIATSRGLAAQALLQVEEQPDLGLLLAVAAVNGASTADARGGLLSTLHRLPRLELTLRPPLGTQLTSIVGVDYSRDGHRVAAVDRDGALMVWDAATGRPLSSVPAGSSEVHPTCMSVDPSGDTVVVGTNEGDIFRWVITHGALHRERFARVPSGVVALAFRSNGKALAALAATGAIFRWDSVGRPLPEGPIVPHDRATFNADGELLASSSKSGAVSVTSMSTGEVRTFDIGDRTDITELTFDDSDERLALAGVDGRTFRLNLATGNLTKVFAPGLGARAGALAFNGDGGTLAVGYVDASGEPVISLFRGPTTQPVGESFDALAAWDEAPTDGPDGMAISPDGRTIATPGAGGAVRLWDATDDLPIGRFVNRGGREAAISRDGRTLAVERPGRIVLSDVDTGEKLDELDVRKALGGGRLGWLQELSLSPDGSLLASDYDRVGTVLWRIDGERHVSRDSIVLDSAYYFAAFGGPDTVALDRMRGSSCGM